MTPYELTMLIEIYCGPGEPSATPCDLRAQTLEKFYMQDLIKAATDCDRGYRATARARAFIDHLCAQPLPEQQWVMPRSASESHWPASDGPLHGVPSMQELHDKTQRMRDAHEEATPEEAQPIAYVVESKDGEQSLHWWGFGRHLEEAVKIPLYARVPWMIKKQTK